LYYNFSIRKKLCYLTIPTSGTEDERESQRNSSRTKGNSIYGFSKGKATISTLLHGFGVDIVFHSLKTVSDNKIRAQLHLSYEERLRQLGLLSQEKRRL